MKLSERLHQPEWMDLGSDYYSPDEYKDCLFKLDRVGRLLGGDRATFWALNQLQSPPQSILDVGCGGGLFTIKLAQRYPHAHVVGTDIASEAIQFAREQQFKHSPSLSNLEFIIPSKPELDFPPKSFDVVLSTLVCHHLSDEQLISFLQRSCEVAKQAVIINDLHRHPLATAGFNMVIPLLFNNRMVIHDGLLSIKRAFTRNDWIAYLKAAGIPATHYSISWHWAFRWIILIKPLIKTSQS